MRALPPIVGKHNEASQPSSSLLSVAVCEVFMEDHQAGRTVDDCDAVAVAVWTIRACVGGGIERVWMKRRFAVVAVFRDRNLPVIGGTSGTCPPPEDGAWSDVGWDVHRGRVDGSQR